MTKITLYHAEWCGHCKNFIPVWNELKTQLESHNIEHSEFEHSKDAKIIEASNIDGFPTIKINKNGDEYEYQGKRNKEDIMTELLKLTQSGGTLCPCGNDIKNCEKCNKVKVRIDQVEYKHKYMKYKLKYLNLKKQIAGTTIN